jgi:hypothetical protein
MKAAWARRVRQAARVRQGVDGAIEIGAVPPAARWRPQGHTSAPRITHPQLGVALRRSGWCRKGPARRGRGADSLPPLEAPGQQGGDHLRHVRDGERHWSRAAQRSRHGNRTGRSSTKSSITPTCAAQRSVVRGDDPGSPGKQVTPRAEIHRAPDRRADATRTWGAVEGRRLRRTPPAPSPSLETSVTRASGRPRVHPRSPAP